MGVLVRPLSWIDAVASFDCSLRSRSGWGNPVKASRKSPHPEQRCGGAAARVEGRRDADAADL